MIFGLTPEQIVSIATAIGPGVIYAFGIVLAALFSVIGWFARRLWRAHIEQTTDLSDALKELSKGIDDDRAEHQKEIRAVEKMVEAVKIEVALVNQSIVFATASMNELKGVTQAQQATLNELSDKLGTINGKMKAVFRMIDAPSRATDRNGG